MAERTVDNSGAELYPEMDSADWQGAPHEYSSAPSGSVVKHDQLPDVTPSDELDFISSGKPLDTLLENPDEYFTAYDKKIIDRIMPRKVPNIGGIVSVGATQVAGWSLTWTAAAPAAPIYLRDGIDASAPVLLVIDAGNFNYGTPGIHFEYGVYLDLNGNTAALGSVLTVQDFSA